MNKDKVESNNAPSDRLNEEQFTFKISRDGKVIISFEGRVVTTVKGKRAHRFIDNAETATLREIQLRLAKLTGNFKRGNERA